MVGFNSHKLNLKIPKFTKLIIHVIFLIAKLSLVNKMRDHKRRHFPFVAVNNIHQ